MRVYILRIEVGYSSISIDDEHSLLCSAEHRLLINVYKELNIPETTVVFTVLI